MQMVTSTFKISTIYVASLVVLLCFSLVRNVALSVFWVVQSRYGTVHEKMMKHRAITVICSYYTYRYTSAMQRASSVREDQNLKNHKSHTHFTGNIQSPSPSSGIIHPLPSTLNSIKTPCYLLPIYKEPVQAVFTSIKI